jgi:hypothetical protein
MTVIADPDLSETLQKDFAAIGFDNLQLIVPSDQAEQYFNDSYKNIAPEDLLKMQKINLFLMFVQLRNTKKEILIRQSIFILVICRTKKFHLIEKKKYMFIAKRESAQRSQ